MISIALDMMGGDLGLEATIEGAKLFHQSHPEVKLIFVGKADSLPKDFGEIVEAKDVVPMDAGPLDALRMKESSMYKAVELVKSGTAQGVVSCGGTGAYLSCATVRLRMIEGIKRSALVTPMPTKVKGKRVVFLDCGANNENSPDELEQFGVMGSAYCKAVFGIESPEVYLLSNGSEEHKGSPEGKEAYKLLANNDKVNFKGNIEANEALTGKADVIVADGFSGNVLLKASEGVAKVMGGMMKGAFKRNLLSKIGYLFCRKGIREMSDTMDAKKIGGAMLVGVNGTVVKAHGNSNGEAFFHAIEVAYKLIQNDLLGKIKESI